MNDEISKETFIKNVHRNVYIMNTIRNLFHDHNNVNFIHFISIDIFSKVMNSFKLNVTCYNKIFETLSSIDQKMIIF